jgi:hypothetical protein
MNIPLPMGVYKKSKPFFTNGNGKRERVIMTANILFFSWFLFKEV